MQIRTLSQIIEKARQNRSCGLSWERTAEECDVMTAKGKPNPGLIYRMVMNGYNPKLPATRLRLGLPPICPTCYQRMPKPPRVTKFDPAQMNAVVAFLRERERGPRVYARKKENT